MATIRGLHNGNLQIVCPKAGIALKVRSNPNDLSSSIPSKTRQDSVNIPSGHFQSIANARERKFDALKDGLQREGMTSAKPVARLEPNSAKVAKKLQRSKTVLNQVSVDYSLHGCLSENIRRIYASSNEEIVLELSNSSQSVNC